MNRTLPEHDPTEQGLKPELEKALHFKAQLPEHDPTEQGLKLVGAIVVGSCPPLPEHDPTEQGLKLVTMLNESMQKIAPRA